MKKSIPLDAPYKAGFYTYKLHFHTMLLINPKSMGIPSMDLLNTVTPIKSSALALFPAKKSREIVKTAESVYACVEKIKNDESAYDECAREIDKNCALLMHLVTEAAEGSLSGRHRHLYDSGKLLSIWHNRLEPPFALSPNELMTINMTFKATNIPDIAGLIIATNQDIAEGIPDIHDRIWNVHLRMLEEIKLEAARAVIEAEGLSREGVSHVTGLPNLVTFEKDQESFFRSEILPFTLAFLDIDNFKKLNSIAGHDEADEVIRELGSFLRTRLVGRAKVYHRSGDEFYIVMENTAADEAELLMNRMLKALLETTFSTSTGNNYRISVSIGMSSFPKHGRNIETLRKRANEAEKKSKELGKSCCTVFGST